MLEDKRYLFINPFINYLQIIQADETGRKLYSRRDCIHNYSIFNTWTDYDRQPMIYTGEKNLIKCPNLLELLLS